VDDRRQMTARAIVDDLQNERQYLIAEQDTLGRAQVYRILRDRIILRLDGREEVLWLSFSGGKDRGPGPSRSQQTTATGPAAAEPLEVTRYGKRVGERRWVMQRESLMDYYEELLDEPERLANIYISLKPDYNENQRIDGYELDMAGEEDFFKAVGLRQGDHIRKVNSMRMTSQSRAEYFLSEFAKNRVSALVLDIERANEPMKLIYLIR
jgi:type II secretory pathway component PulC